MFQLAETTHSEFFRKPGKGEEWMKRGDLGQEKEPVHEKAGGWQNSPGGSSGNVPEVAKFNHNLQYVDVICRKYLDTRICGYEATYPRLQNSTSDSKLH